MMQLGQGYRTCIISHLRPESVPKMQAFAGETVFWYVGKGEAEAYRASGAKYVIESGGLCESRNAALRDAFNYDLDCLQLSDDLTKLEHTTDGKEKKPMTLAEAVSIIQTELGKTNFKMAGTATTPNLFYFHNYTARNLFIVGDFIYVKKCDLFFDENLRLKEDYDYTVRHIKRYFGVLRINGIMPTFKHRTNKGGAVAVRTSEVEKQCIEYLFQKHPGWFRMNPRRPDEILMRKVS